MARRSVPILAAVFVLVAMAAPAMAGVLSDERCGQGVDPIDAVTITRAGGTVNAAFTVNESCDNLPVTLAVHDHSRTGNDRLGASQTKKLDGGTHTLSTAVRACDVTAYLVTGPADADVVKYAAETRQEAEQLLTVGKACSAAADPPSDPDTGTAEEELPFTGPRTTTMLLGVGLLAVGVIATWSGRYRGTRAAGDRR